MLVGWLASKVFAIGNGRNGQEFNKAETLTSHKCHPLTPFVTNKTERDPVSALTLYRLLFDIPHMVPASFSIVLLIRALNLIWLNNSI